MPDVAIISTGNELIYGRTRDLNSAFLSDKLFPTGLRVRLHMTVGDVDDDIARAVKEASSIADITILTGGLGPTEDDQTLEVLRRLYGFSVVINAPGLKKMEEFFSSMGKPVVDGDLKMVTVPEGAIIFENDLGLAAGFALENGEKLLIAMPGVPREMRYMFEHRVMPYLAERYSPVSRPFLEFRIILVREAEADRKVKEMNLPFGDVDWGITTTPGMNTLTFVGKEGKIFPEKAIISEMRRCLGDNLLSPGYTNLESELVDLMARRWITLSVAESCSGGLIAKRITDVPGASRVFLGGVVAYSNEAKQRFLDVPGNVLESYGAVSEETARAMADGARKRFGSDIAVSVTGIAGPEGGTSEKPVGMVCFGAALADSAKSFTVTISGDRERIRMMSSQYAMDYVWRIVKSVE